MDQSPPLSNPPSRAEVDAYPGPLVLEFGTAWCGYCRSFAPIFAQLLKSSSGVRHIKVEDGPGEPLGRSFGVKLWPTLVFLRDGRVRHQVARPTRDETLTGLRAISSARSSDPG
jgi:thioredoxin 1